MFHFSFIKNLLSRIYDFFTSSLVLINNLRKHEFGKSTLRRLRRFILAMIIFKWIPYITNDFFKCPYDFPKIIQTLNDFSDSYSRIISNLDVSYDFLPLENRFFTDITNISFTNEFFTRLTTPVDSVTTPIIHITETTLWETMLSKLSLVFGMLYSPPYDKIKGSVYSDNVFDTICYKLHTFSSWMWVSDDLDETKIGLDGTIVEKLEGIMPQEYWVALLYFILMSIVWNWPNWATPDVFYPEEYSSNEILKIDKNKSIELVDNDKDKSIELVDNDKSEKSVDNDNDKSVKSVDNDKSIELPDNDKSIELPDYNTLFNFGKLDNYRSIFDTIKTAFNQVNHVESNTDILNEEKLFLLCNLHEYLRNIDIINSISDLKNIEDKNKLIKMFELYNVVYLERSSTYSEK